MKDKKNEAVQRDALIQALGRRGYKCFADGDDTFVVESPSGKVKAGSLQEAIQIATQQMSEDLLSGSKSTRPRKDDVQRRGERERHNSNGRRQHVLPDPHEEMLRDLMDKPGLARDEAEQLWQEEYENL
ncbi:MAG: hypothetical protein H6839_14705 [Planctomycetes bacterium]|nr:hypothetical protein [Planctomycetota bacterium]